MQGHPWMKQENAGASLGRMPNKPWRQNDTHFIVRLEARHVTERIRKTTREMQICNAQSKMSKILQSPHTFTGLYVSGIHRLLWWQK